MTTAQNIFLLTIAGAFLVWGVNRFDSAAAAVLAIVIAVVLVLAALFGKF